MEVSALLMKVVHLVTVGLFSKPLKWLMVQFCQTSSNLLSLLMKDLKTREFMFTRQSPMRLVYIGSKL